MQHYAGGATEVRDIRADDLQGRLCFIGLATRSDAVDNDGDEIARGALLPLPEPGITPVLLHHRPEAAVGLVDRWEVKDGGWEIHAHAWVSTRTERGRQAALEVREGLLRGLSIAFSVPTGGMHASPSGRGHVITRARLSHLSLTALPCLPSARISQLFDGGAASAETAAVMKALDNLATRDGIAHAAVARHLHAVSEGLATWIVGQIERGRLPPRTGVQMLRDLLADAKRHGV